VNDLKNIFFLIFIVGGLAVLQVFLSLRKNKWLGLLLPVLNLLYALFASFGQMIYTGEVLPILVTCMMLSIPAIINLIIYFACREKVRERDKDELQKMNIQDLD